ncbi:MAG: PEGA domain-containing protein [Haliea sp.]|nr:PEGA domain-containing protein [Haliea sp.]
MSDADNAPLEAIEPSAFEPLEPGAAPPPRRANPLRWVLLGTAAVFLLVMAFLLTARSLQVVVIAENPAEVDIDGLALPFGERYLLRPGTYQVTATAEGYHPMVTEVTVNDRDSQRAELVLRPLPGLLSVNSQPPGAKVLIDGEAVGETPLADLPVEAGEHQLQVQLDRYLPHAQPLEITGRQLPQGMELALSPAWAEVSIDSRPAGADILVDGETVATTPATVEILQGERQLILQLASFADWGQILELTAGQPQDLGTVELQPAAGVLELASKPAGANVTLNGEFQGQTPLTLEISPGRKHRLAVFKPGYRRYNGSVELPAAGRDERTISLKAQLGEVRFEISPANAILRVDGKPRGRGSQTLSLPAFEHSVEVALEGHATVRRRVTPRPGLQQLVQVTLQTEQAARMARLKPEITTSLGQTLLLFKPGESAQADFTMGASRREPGRRANEVLHPVSLRRMFYLSTTEVTNAQFRLYQADHNSGQIDGNSLNREHQPAVQVSWQQAASFCNWLSKREGLPPFYRETKGIINGYNPSATGYRLPSEAEWAWAARADGPNWLKFPWGDSFPPTLAVENYADNTSAYVTGRILNGYTDGHVTSATVASFGPNSKGLYDLGGNVAEWAHDVYGIPSANGATQTDPLGPQGGDNYVIRGASWAHSKIAELRLSHRDYGQAGRDDVGFRLARYAE